MMARLYVPRPSHSTGASEFICPRLWAASLITLKHFKNMLLGRTKVTMQYPEENGTAACRNIIAARLLWSATRMAASVASPASFANSSVRRARSRSCRAKFQPTDRFAKVEKYPEEFDIDMVRCIFCGMCEEVCPEQAIYLRKDYAITGFTREEMVHHKDKLLEIGGVMHGVVLKWNEKK